MNRLRAAVVAVALAGLTAADTATSPTVGPAWTVSTVLAFENTPAPAANPVRLVAGTWTVDLLLGFGNPAALFVGPGGYLGEVQPAPPVVLTRGRAHRIDITAAQSGPDVAITLVVDAVQVAAGTIASAALPASTCVMLNPTPVLASDDVTVVDAVTVTARP